jgi:hypothetical protein
VLCSLTTLPNVVTAVRLAVHGRGAAVVSEAFNSNSLNILAGLVIPALFLSLGAASGVQAFSAWWLLGMTVVAIALCWSGRGLQRLEGAAMVLLYVPFVIVVRRPMSTLRPASRRPAGHRRLVRARRASAGRPRSDFVRRTTVIHLHGAGHEGVGEDVIYDADDQGRFQDAGSVLDLAGEHTLDSPLAAFEGIEDLRRWGFESAALDLALRQNGLSLHGVLGREPRPVTFVVSTSLPDGSASGCTRSTACASSSTPRRAGRRSSSPSSRPSSGGRVDFKEAYTWRAHERTPPPSLYRLVVGALPEALIEDPDLTGEKGEILEPHRERITWDAPIHSVADVDALAFPPNVLNSKPSSFRFGEAPL